MTKRLAVNKEGFKHVKKRKQSRTSAITATAQVTHGMQWLEQMKEDDFRDEVLKELFAQMQKQGAIAGYIYTHGRGEHGVDWIVIERGPLTDRYVGIQAKSKPITKQGDSYSDSALAIKQQCESAYDHRFNFNGSDIRIDNVELWMSTHITSDAAEEFLAPLSRHKIGVKRPDVVFSLIERYCPLMTSKIPGLAESGYIHRMANPDPLPIRIFGVPLNPQKHFLEPRFSKHPELSISRVFDKRRHRMHEESPICLHDVTEHLANTIFVGPQLSGKTYLLRRLSCVLANQGYLPVHVDACVINTPNFKSIWHYVADRFPWHSPASLSNPDYLTRTVVLLIDNADCLTTEQIESLRDATHKRILLILAGRKSRTVPSFQTLFISGIMPGTIHSFVRSLDISEACTTALTDRGSQYIQRTIGTSGLPTNPFTVSVMLQECQIAKRKLATPTMGRLIERFVEGQIGSHSESMRADFETKLAFLTSLGGTRELSFPASKFRKRLVRFLTKHGHAHDAADFEHDLLDSGLLDRDVSGITVRWTHPVFVEFFWVSNMVREKRYDFLGKCLLHDDASSIASIVGSQMGNAHKVLSILLKHLEKKAWMTTKGVLRATTTNRTDSFVLPSDEDEEALLTSIEADANGTPSSSKPSLNTHNEKPSSDAHPASDEIARSLELYATHIVEEKHYLAANIGALLLNARGLPRHDKEQGVMCVLRSTSRMGEHFSAMLHAVSHGKLSPLMADVFATYWCLVIADGLIGDAFLSEIFRGLTKTTNQTDQKLALIDLLVACGSAAPSSYLNIVKKQNLSDMVAVYMRLVTMYYFRFHKSEEKAALRESLKELRKMAKGFSLPSIS